MANPYLSDEARAVLARSKVGIAGAGGLGSNCAMHLVRAGVRRLVICDFDVVSESNLNRQFYFRDQLGCKKVAALGDNLRRIEPDLELELLDLRLDAATLGTVFSDCDVVVEAFDAAEAKVVFLSALLPGAQRLVSASGMAGIGRSNAMRVRAVGERLVLVGDGESGVSDAAPPQSPRVGIAAAMEANSVLALLLGYEV